MAEARPVIDDLYDVIASRKGGEADQSYTAKLYAGGRAGIVRKFGEEALEVCVASLAEGRRRVIAESGDLLYHLLVLWAEQGIRPAEVWDELAGRFGVSGIEEKQARGAARTEEDR